MTIELTQRFVRQYQKLPAGLQTKVNQIILTLVESDFRHFGLDSRKVEGAACIFETAFDHQYRLTFERRSDTFILRNLDAI
jgi:hypothetical protein